MKKIFLLLASLVAMPAFGLDIHGGENVNISQEILSNTYIAGGTINATSQVKGEMNIAGGNITINSDVQENLLVVGGSININSNIAQNVKIAGGNINLNSKIGKDLLVMGGNINISKDTVISGDVLIFGGNITINGKILGKALIKGGTLTLNGQIAGDADITADKIDISGDTKIGGNLNYKSKQQSSALENVVVGNKTFEQHARDKGQSKDYNKGSIIGGMGAYIFISLFIIGLILFLSMPNLWISSAKLLAQRPWGSLLNGLIYFALMPFLVIILMITVIGIPIGFFLLCIYIFSFVFYKLINVLVFSGLIIDKMGYTESLWKKVLVILVLSLISAFIPVIDLFAAFFSFGAVYKRKVEILESIR